MAVPSGSSKPEETENTGVLENRQLHSRPYSVSNSFSFASSRLRLSKLTQLGILHFQFPFCGWEGEERISFTRLLIIYSSCKLALLQAGGVQPITCVAGVFILAELPRLSMSCMVTMEVLATEERAVAISAQETSKLLTCGRYLNTWKKYRE